MRWVFQLRIPLDLRAHFNERTTVRKHLGNLPQPQAQAMADALASAYEAEFKGLRETNAPMALSMVPAEPVARPRQPLSLDAEMNRRFISTWQQREATRLVSELTTLAEATEVAWQAAIAKARSRLPALRDALRRNAGEGFQEIRMALEAELDIRLVGTEARFASLCRDWNAANLAFAEASIEVLEGKRTMADLVPAHASQLPIVELWGTPAETLVEAWAARKRQFGVTPNLKTQDKYQAVERDLLDVIGRRPVESLTLADMQTLVECWRERGNKPKTMAGKVQSLKYLLSRYLSPSQLEAFDTIIPQLPVMASRRMPFLEVQLHQLLQAILTDNTLEADDAPLLLLMTLTGARLEEVCQLSAGDISRQDGRWYLSFADAQQTGQGNAQLKNAVSARRVPVHVDIFEGLEDWLAARVAQGGPLFPDLRPNKYGLLGDAVSKRLNRRIDKYVSADRRLVLESLRNTAARAMRRQGADARLRQRHLGHAAFGVHDVHYDPSDLIDDVDLAETAEAIASFLRRTLEGKRLPRLGQCRDGNANAGQTLNEVVEVTLDPQPEQIAPLNFEESEAEFGAALNLVLPPCEVASPAS